VLCFPVGNARAVLELDFVARSIVSLGMLVALEEVVGHEMIHTASGGLGRGTVPGGFVP